MDKVYNHKGVEEKIYKNWEESGYFKPEINPKGEPYSIILPPTNANGALHFGHAMYVVEDILIRYHRMKGFSALWLPGTDHAGIETQFVFEKKLREQGKSRLDFKKEELYEMIKKYVDENRGGIERQLRRLGFSLDWSREKYTLDKDVVEIVYDTFKKLFTDGLVYRAERLVNYCTFDGTSFSDLEVKDLEVEAQRGLYTIKYPLVEGGFIKVATTRPETMFGDVAIMVNAKDTKHKDKIGKRAVVPLINKEIPIIGDEYVDMNFGTGAVKVTPMHDFNDFDVAQRHKFLNAPAILGFDGKIKGTGTKYDGLRVVQARLEIEKDLRKKELFVDVVRHKMVLKTCYKCGKTLEPLPLEQWFIKMESLAKQAIDAVNSGKIKIYPKSFEKRYFQFLENIRDWNISRQIVWGIQIPAWFREWKPTADLRAWGFHERTEQQVLSGKTKTYRLQDRDFNEFKKGDRCAFKNSQTGKIFGYGTILSAEQKTVGEIPLDDKAHGTAYKERKELIKAFKFHKPELDVTEKSKVWIYTYSFGVLQNGKIKEIYVGEEKPAGENWRKDKDTFDTWFSSGQWPYATLKTTNCLKFYPVDVMETGYDILPWWVARMVMLEIYIQQKQDVKEIEKQIPFKEIVLHGLVNDPLGKKMSKSKGNVVNPIDLVEQYGADSVRLSLVYGTAFGNDQALSYSKLEAARKFINKLWNIARFIEMKKFGKDSGVAPLSGFPQDDVILASERGERAQNLLEVTKNKNDREMIKKTKQLTNEITKYLDSYNFNYAIEALYDFVWHTFADKYIEDVKNRIDENSFLILNSLFLILLKLLHPFIPFVTEEIYQRLKAGESIMIEKWPQLN